MGMGRLGVVRGTKVTSGDSGCGVLDELWKRTIFN